MSPDYRDLPLVGFVRAFEVYLARPETAIDDLPHDQFPGSLRQQEHVAEGSRTQQDGDSPIEEELLPLIDQDSGRIGNQFREMVHVGQLRPQ